MKKVIAGGHDEESYVYEIVRDDEGERKERYAMYCVEKRTLASANDQEGIS